MRMLKKQHTREELSALSQKATESLLKRIHQEENCQTVLLYHSLPDEVDTHLLIQALAAEGKKVLLPTIVGTELELHKYIDEQTFRTSESFGIQESQGPLFTNYSQIDLAIIPGMAFSIFNAEGRRFTYNYCANDLADEIIGMWVWVYHLNSHRFTKQASV